MRVLYVDDEAGLLEVGKLFLEMDGEISVETVLSASAALESLKKQSFDAIVSDYQMPVMDGIAFLKQVRSRFDTIPFILFTGRGREEVVIEALNEGADFYLQKGGHPNALYAELSHKIHQAVSRTRAEKELRSSRENLEQQHQILSTLHTLEREFAELPSGKSVEDLVASRLLALSGAVVTVFSKYDPGEQMLKTTVLKFGPGELENIPGAWEKVARWTGMQPDKVEVPISREMYQDISRSMVVTRKNLAEISHGKISPAVAAGIQKLAGIDRFIQITHILDGELYGISVMGLRPSRPDLSPELLESLAHIVAVSLRRQRAEEEIRKSEASYRGLFDTIRQALYMLDREGKFVDVNAGAEKMYGYAREEFIGRTPEFLSAPGRNDLPAVAKKIQKAFAGEPQQFEFWGLRKNGEVFPKDVFLYHGTYFGGDIVLAVGIDITERRKAENALRESENKFATVFRRNPVTLTLVSATDGRFIDVNDAFVANTGYSREEVIGRTSEELDIFADIREYEQLVTELRSGQPVKGMELRIRQKNGEVRACQFSSGIILMQGRPHILSSVEDIADRKNAELAFQAMTAGMVGTTGRGSLDRIAESIRSWLGPDCIMIGEILPDQKRVKVLAMLLDGKKVEDYTYTLEGTPCENTAEKGFCLYPDNVAGIFPKSRDLRELNIRGYAGTPLRNADGRTIGVLCILTRKPLILPAEGRKILDIIAVKAAAGIEHRQGEERLIRINEALLHLGTDHKKNIESLTRLCGEMLEADCTLYNRLDGGQLCVIGQWNGPSDLPSGDKPEGHICFDVIRGDQDSPVVVCDLQNTPYARTDPHVAAYGLRTYIGHPVRFGGVTRGSLCAVYTRDIVPTIEDQEVIGILSSAIAQEEERRQADRALRESEEKFREIFNSANDGIHLYQFDENYAPDKYVDVNEVVCRMLQYSKEELMQKRPTDISTRYHNPPEEQIGMQLKETGHAVFETGHVRKDGTIIPVEINAHIISLGGKDLVLSIARDITERKRAAEALVESGMLLRQVIDNANDEILLVKISRDGPGKILLANDQTARALGYSKEELLTISPRDFVPEGTAEKIMPVIVRDLKKDGYAVFESEHRRKDGSTYPVEVSLRRFCYQGEEVDLSIVRDISGRRQAEEAIQKNEKRLRRFYESGLFGVIFWNNDGTITDANDKFLSILGYTREDLEAGLINGFGITPPEFAHVDEQAMAELIATGVNRVPLEKEYLRKDGTRVPVILAGAMLNEQRTEGVGFVLDITGRKMAEGALRQANRKLNLLSGITRHDIKNQLLALSGYLEFSKKTLADPARTAEFIEKEKNVVGIISSQISFTKDYENLGVKAPAWQNIPALIGRIIAGLPLRDIQIDCGDPNLEVFADPLLEKVFYNVIDNALRYGGEKMTVIRIHTRTAGEDLIILVEDDGAGISAEDRERLFERGYGKNTGLGLFLSREILSITGITITETGEPGTGARFEMTVPAGQFRFVENR